MLLTSNDLRLIIEKRPKFKNRPDTSLTVKSINDGLQIWNNKAVLAFWNNRAMTWRPKRTSAVFIPCSAQKPYPYSRSHMGGYLKALLPYLDFIDLFAVSEPMGVVPYSYADEYPINSYEYDPHKFFMGKMANPTVQSS